ncbi:MAG: 30S ribosomal protein S12 methylthiotransferase RimO [Clostridia bacterium]|nr:30S ribosomal protein S12 methylthiotransferase RimO [Clostridia bacterium]
MENKLIGVISLGCDKNRVDTEKMLAVLRQKHTLTDDIDKAQIIIINTCAFLRSARRESIDEILSAAELKNGGALEKLIITGCLPQKFAGEMFGELKEVDAFLGISDYDRILEIIDELYEKDERINGVGNPSAERGVKRQLTTDGYAYLKIADGCDNHCTYCLIPKIRGKYRSVAFDALIEEARLLGEVRELILVAQDTSRYGEDLTPKRTLVDLIRALSLLSNVKGIRLLYCYPENITDELIREFQFNPKLIRYIDIPLQHASDRILKLMNRKGTGAGYLALIERLKREIYGIAIRSTFIAGFPTETEEDFNALVDFIRKAKLFNAGFFKYSREEGTAAYNLDGQIKESVKTKRLKKLYSEQKKVVKENGKALIGKTFKVCAEGFDRNELIYYGRAYFNAPDIDGNVKFFSGEEVVRGEFYEVKITGVSGYDLYGERI